MKVQKYLLSALTIAALSACTTAGGNRAKPISDYPEARSYGDCVIGKARSYAPQPGSPVDLAIIAVGACRTERNAMENVLSRDNSPTFANEFMRRNDQTMVEIAGEVIVEARR